MWTAVGAFFGGISPRVWKFLGIALAVVALLWLINHAIKSYGDVRYNDGVAAEKAAWQEADRQLQIKVIKSQAIATKDAVKREATYAAQVSKEREKINEAATDGRSPFDFMFGS